MISKGNHVKLARFVLLAVSEEAKEWLPASFASLTEQVIEKIVEDKDSQKTKMSTKVAKELFADYVKEKKLRELEEKKELAQTLKTYILCRSEKERIRSMYNKTIIRFGFCDIQNNQGLRKDCQPQPSASADNLYLDLDYSGYHKNLIQ